jgi:hypothetical protein
MHSGKNNYHRGDKEASTLQGYLQKPLACGNAKGERVYPRCSTWRDTEKELGEMSIFYQPIKTVGHEALYLFKDLFA